MCLPEVGVKKKRLQRVHAWACEGAEERDRVCSVDAGKQEQSGLIEMTRQDIFFFRKVHRLLVYGPVVYVFMSSKCESMH